MDCIVHGVAKSRTTVRDFLFHFGGKWHFPSGSDGKASACNAGDLGSTTGSWVEKIHWRREWLPMATHSSILAWRITRTLRSLAGYSV